MNKIYLVKKFIKRNIISICIFLILFSYILFSKLPQYQADSKLFGKKSKDFVLENLKGISWSSKTNLGKKTLLYFFTTWCSACHLQLPVIKKVSQRFPPSQFSFIAISPQKQKVLESYKEKEKIGFPIYKDDMEKAHSAFQILSYPTFVWIDENGVIEDIEHGLDLLLFYKVRYWLNDFF